MRRVTEGPWVADLLRWTFPEFAIFGADQSADENACKYDTYTEMYHVPYTSTSCVQVGDNKATSDYATFLLNVPPHDSKTLGLFTNSDVNWQCVDLRLSYSAMNVTGITPVRTELLLYSWKGFPRQDHSTSPSKKKITTEPLLDLFSSLIDFLAEPD